MLNDADATDCDILNYYNKSTPKCKNNYCNEHFKLHVDIMPE